MILFVAPTVCMCVYECHHRSPKRLFNQTVEKGKPVPGFRHSDGPGNAFIPHRFITRKVPLLSFCASLGAQFLMQPYKKHKPVIHA